MTVKIQDNPKLEIKNVNGNNTLYFTFKGKLTERDAINAVKNWKRLKETLNSEQILVWNCLEMTQYDPMARIVWQNAIKEMKKEIKKIWLISDSTVILSGAKILSLFTSLDIEIVKSEKQIVKLS